MPEINILADKNKQEERVVSQIEEKSFLHFIKGSK